jgi:hypothetical protein
MSETDESAVCGSENEIESGEPESPDRPSDNRVVLRCMRAYSRGYNKKLAELDEDESELRAKEAGSHAYLCAMPPVSGYENIRDFIACVTYGSLSGIIRQPDAEHYLSAAKVALGTLSHEEKFVNSATRRPGRPRKSPATEENK